MTDCLPDWLTDRRPTDSLPTFLTDGLEPSLDVSLLDWLTDRPIDWLTYWLTDWVTDWPTTWLTDWLINRHTDGRTDCLIQTDRLKPWLSACSIAWLMTDRLGDSPTDCQTGWLTKCLAYCLANLLTNWLTYWEANRLIWLVVQLLRCMTVWLTSNLLTDRLT